MENIWIEKKKRKELQNKLEEKIKINWKYVYAIVQLDEYVVRT